MVAVVAQQDKDHLTLKVSGRFTFSIYKEFYSAYKELAEKPRSVDVDLRGVEYMDSAALGMLLSMRNYFGPEAKLRLLNPNDTVRKILEIARFDKTFQFG
jgi:HptB-dependent secretion and biofilm anti anti-sigma factor